MIDSEIWLGSEAPDAYKLLILCWLCRLRILVFSRYCVFI